MKRLFVLLCLSALILLTACSVSLNKNDLEPTPFKEADFGGGVLMTADESEVPPKTPTMMLNIVNATEKEITFGVDYTLEVYLEGEWFVVPPKEEMFFIMIAQILEPGGTTQLEAMLSDAYGSLPEGKYRFVKSFWLEHGGTAAAAEFKIVKQ